MYGVSKVYNWGTHEVISWLKSTRDGKFEDLVDIFEKHEIEGDALLELTDEILKDEMGIESFGKRFALVKAIRQLKEANEPKKSQNFSQMKKLRQKRIGTQPKTQVLKMGKQEMIPSSGSDGESVSNSTKRYIYIKKKPKKSSKNKSEQLLNIPKVSATYTRGDPKLKYQDDISSQDIMNLEKMKQFNLISSNEYNTRIIEFSKDNINNTKTQMGTVTSMGTAKNGTLRNSRKLSMHSNYVIPTRINVDTKTPLYLYRGGPDGDIEKMEELIFDKTMPKWDEIEGETAMKFAWNNKKLKWDEKEITVKISPHPFGRGSLRLSYYMLELPKNFQNDNVISKSKSMGILKKNSNSKSEVDTDDSINRKNTDDLRGVYKTSTSCSFEQYYREKTNDVILAKFKRSISSNMNGTLCVAKSIIDLTEPVHAYFNDVRTQCEAQRFADEYNKYNPPKKIAFLGASVIQLIKREDKPLYCIEDYLHGSYIKHLDNHGGDEGLRNTPAAFAHFTYQASNHKLLVCDIQGVGDIYTDPQIHTFDGRGYGKGNLGINGMIRFLHTHECNPICQHLKLEAFNLKQEIDGTVPIQKYMKQRNINTIPTQSTLSALPENLQIVNNLGNNNANENIDNNATKLLNEEQLNKHNLQYISNKNYTNNSTEPLIPKEDHEKTGCCASCIIL